MNVLNTYTVKDNYETDENEGEEGMDQKHEGKGEKEKGIRGMSEGERTK